MQSTKKILLLVSGMSPQIITETLYALITQPQPWVPDEVHLITTENGKNNAVLQLLEGKKYFTQLLKDYQISKPILFNKSCIHLICQHGKALEDLRTPEDNEAAADCISDKIREFTLDDHIELHVSLAGGRKTMGFYAGYALSLFGRSQDKLSHVLVSENYESNRDFFYPTPNTQVVYDKNNNALDTQKAKIWLAEIPFVRLRSGLPEKLLQGTSSFSETIKLARCATESPHLIINTTNLSAQLHDQVVRLTPAHMVLLLWVHHHGPIGTLVDGEKSSDYKQQYFDIADRYDIDLHGSSQTQLQKGMTKEFMEPNISRLNSTFKKAFGTALAYRCKLASRKINKSKAYALPEDLIMTIEKGKV